VGTLDVGAQLEVITDKKWEHTPGCVGRVVQVPSIPIFLRDDLQGDDVFLLTWADALDGPQYANRHEPFLSLPQCDPHFRSRAPCTHVYW
jgi:hypothetical protein